MFLPSLLPIIEGISDIVCSITTGMPNAMAFTVHRNNYRDREEVKDERRNWRQRKRDGR